MKRVTDKSGVLYESGNKTRTAPWKAGVPDGHSWFVYDDDDKLVATCATQEIQDKIIDEANKWHFEDCKGVSKRGRILRLSLKKKWFDMIASGIKKEEYRDVKPWATSRLFRISSYDEGDGIKSTICAARGYDFVEFKNGYGKNAPVVVTKFVSVCQRLRPKHMEWGEPDTPHYVIELGEKMYG